MTRLIAKCCCAVALGAVGLMASAVRAEGEGQADLDEAMRVRIASPGLDQGVSAEVLRDVNRAIDLLQSALDKGLDNDNQQFATQLLAESLVERASALIEVLQRQPADDPRMAQLRRQAISDLRRVLAADAPFPPARFLLARLLTAPDGDPHEAKRLLNEYLLQPPEDPGQHAEALVLRGLLQSDPKRAEADFNHALELVPNDVSVRLARAQFLRSQENRDAALVDVEAALQLDADNLPARLVQGELLRELGRVDEAIAAFDAITRAAPQALEPYQSRGEIYRQQGAYKKAIAQFTQVLNLRPGTLLTLLHRAEAYLLDGQFALAQTDVEAALEQEPGLVAGHRLRAQALASQDRLGEAIEEMEQLAEAMPEDGEVRMQLALYYLIDQRPRRAIAAYSEVLAMQPDNVEALRGRGDAYLSVGNHADAIVDFDKALALAPQDVSILNNLAWVLATSPDDAVRNGARSIELATRACEITEHKAAHILSTLAAGYAETGDFAAAQQWSQRAVDLNDPDHQEQLKQELASYREGKPWRERQTTPEREGSAPSTEAAAPTDEQAPVEDEPPPAESPGQSLDF
jgi:tetratricopeptide (TPR) repeat protein